jgi:hypothetical protein
VNACECRGTGLTLRFMEPDGSVAEDVRRRYADLFRRFLGREVGANEFVDAFLDMWKRDRDTGVTTGGVVDQVMTGADCYHPTPDQASAFEVGEEQLRAEVSTALARLTADDG